MDHWPVSHGSADLYLRINRKGRYCGQLLLLQQRTFKYELIAVVAVSNVMIGDHSLFVELEHFDQNYYYKHAVHGVESNLIYILSSEYTCFYYL